MDGRILFYNPHTGHGKLILKSQEKMEFSADLWEDFDVVPSAGKLVSCVIEKGELTSIKALSFEEELDSVEIKKTVQDFSQSEDYSEDESSGSRRPTFSVKETIENYFKPIAIFIGKPPEIVNTMSQLDYFRVKRFLMTSYNDLKGLDSSLHNNTEIKKILDEIQELHKAYRTIEARLDSPKLAFEMIFLRSQPEYLQYIRHKEHCLNRISILSKMEESLFPDLQEKEEELKSIPKDENTKREALEKQLKTLRRHYVDTIHENAEFYEEISTMEDLRAVYIDNYSEEFFSELLKVGGNYSQALRSILNYRAYDFDKLIWKYAEKSKVIREFLASANIEGSYSTLTFLRYYLRTLNPDKLNAEQRELFNLEEYLENVEIYHKNM